MDIDKIKKTVNSDLPDNHKRDILISILANDSDTIPHLLKILNAERERNSMLISETNKELSRALMTIIHAKIKPTKGDIDPNWVIEQIKQHYLKWNNHIVCTFKVEGLP